MKLKKITNIFTVVSLSMIALSVVLFFFSPFIARITVIWRSYGFFVIAAALITVAAAILKIILIIKRSKGAPPKNQTELGRFFDNTARISALIGSAMLILVSAYLCSALVFDRVVFSSWVYDILHFVNSSLPAYFITTAAWFVFALFTLTIASILNRHVKYNKDDYMRNQYGN